MIAPHEFQVGADGYSCGHVAEDGMACPLPKGNRRIHRQPAPAEGPAQSTMDDDGRNWDDKVIDQAIIATAVTAIQFSANDVRPLLPAVSKPRIGARFQALAKAGHIEPVPGRFVKSSDAATHGHRIAVWRATKRTRGGHPPNRPH